MTNIENKEVIGDLREISRTLFLYLSMQLEELKTLHDIFLGWRIRNRLKCIEKRIRKGKNISRNIAIKQVNNNIPLTFTTE